MEFEGRARIRSQLDMAPLIDVVFLLLIFFLLTSSFKAEEAIELQLPSSASAERVQLPPLTVTMAPDGRIALNDRPLSEAALGVALAAAFRGDAERAVVVKTDAALPVQAMLAVMDIIREAGGRNVALATERAP